ncbi:MAG TPA: NADPH:quinone oxidoreductase family protein [Rhizomicrobium sp.]|nr:NADPH:quinone oxidoreductase family protein [Rhizomicrobium sp.]
MKALVAQRLAGLEALALDEVAAPAPGPGEVLIGVGAVGLNLADVAALAGERHPRPDLPFTPGLEVAGLVAATGPDVSGFQPGDRVAAFVGWGGLAEGAVAKAELCARLPDGMALTTAACLPVAYAGALIALRERARLAAGETVLVLGAGGHAGLAAVDIAKKQGARVIAVASGEIRGSEAGERGADEVVDSSARPLSESVAALTHGAGVNVVYDPVGGDAFEMSLLTLANGGRVISAGFAGGRIPRVNLPALHARDAVLFAANTPLTVLAHPADAKAALADVIAWANEAAFEPRIAAQFTLSDAKAGLDYVKSRRNTGAVIVTVGSESL